MIKYFLLLASIVSGLIFGQQKIYSGKAFDSIKLDQIQNALLDDYGNVYLNNRKDLSFTKYDSLGIEQSKLMFTVPFKIQSVQNPLSIFAFSENAQEMKIFDNNLVEIQSIKLRDKFSSVIMAFGEDQQFLWLLDESTKTLAKYQFRDQKIERSFRLDFNFSAVKDLIIYRNAIYVLTNEHLLIYNFKSELIHQIDIREGRKLRRENNDFYIIAKHEIYRWNEDKKMQKVFENREAENVDKNNTQYLAIVKNKLYLYNMEKN